MVTKVRINSIDAIRGFAVFLILLLHSAVLSPGMDSAQPFFVAMFRKFSIGIPIFFVISGYLIARSWEVSQATKCPYVHFYRHRFWRIYPPFVIFLLLNISIYFVAKTFFPEFLQFTRAFISEGDINFYNVMLHLTMLAGFVPETFRTLLDGAWSIYCEVYFYLLYPFFVARFTKSRAALGVFAIAVLILSGIYSGNLGSNWLFSYLYFGQYKSGYSYYAFPSHFADFIVGVCLYHSRTCRHTHPYLIGLLVLGVFGLSEILARASVAWNLSHWPLLMVFVTIYLLLEQVTDRKPGKEVGSLIMTSLRWMGERSYSIFLLHIPVSKMIAYFIYRGSVASAFWPSFWLNLTTTSLITFSLVHLIFRPFEVWTRNVALARDC